MPKCNRCKKCTECGYYDSKTGELTQLAKLEQRREKNGFNTAPASQRPKLPKPQSDGKGA